MLKNSYVQHINNLFWCTQTFAVFGVSRRTVKDIVTFVPVIIILIIPLSPIGHVLVFGAIQRFFPGFFPSCFTESRQNLLQLYESAEYSEVTINETWKVCSRGPHGDAFFPLQFYWFSKFRRSSCSTGEAIESF